MAQVIVPEVSGLANSVKGPQESKAFFFRQIELGWWVSDINGAANGVFWFHIGLFDI